MSRRRKSKGERECCYKRIESALTHVTYSTDRSNPESHKNEGFLKSMWHNLTNHPSHQNGQADKTSSDKKDDKQDKPNDESKKSDTASG